MKSYEGTPSEIAGKVEVVEGLRRRPLRPRTDLRNHSPTGFNWGYGGSGPAQLALAILADLLGTEEALAWYQPFKWRAIANLEQGQPWSLSEQQIRDVLLVLKAEAGGAS